MLKSNLAYYWVADGEVANRNITLQYAEDGLTIGRVDFVDNFLIVFMKLAKTEDEKKHWKEIYLAYRDEIKTYYSKFFPKCTDVQDYEKFNKEIEKE